MKVLAIAYACSPFRGSEAGVGWGWVRAIAERHQVWVITASHWQREIEQGLAAEPELADRVRFLYVPHRWLSLVLALERIWPPVYLFTYQRQWQREALQLARQVHREIGFDLVHQITYVGFRVPGRWWELGIPFVWGPLGGLEQTPWRLLPGMGLSGLIRFACRNVWNYWDLRFNGLVQKALQRASVVIAATEGIRAAIARYWGRDATVIPEVGLPPVVCGRPSKREPSEPLRLVWVGQHVPGKALPLLFRALRLLGGAVDWRLEIYGSGPCTKAWKRACRRMGLANRCVWYGAVPRSDVLSAMARSHALVVTSLYDLTSTVVVEAMASGLPVICPDLYGFRDAVSSDCGIRVPANSVEALVKGIAEAILRLYEREDARRTMGEAALRRAQLYSWSEKAKLISELYERL